MGCRCELAAGTVAAAQQREDRRVGEEAGHLGEHGFAAAHRVSQSCTSATRITLPPALHDTPPASPRRPAASDSAPPPPAPSRAVGLRSSGWLHQPPQRRGQLDDVARVHPHRTPSPATSRTAATSPGHAPARRTPSPPAREARNPRRESDRRTPSRRVREPPAARRSRWPRHRTRSARPMPSARCRERSVRSEGAGEHQRRCVVTSGVHEDLVGLEDDPRRSCAACGCRRAEGTAAGCRAERAALSSSIGSAAARNDCVNPLGITRSRALVGAEQPPQIVRGGLATRR